MAFIPFPNIPAVLGVPPIPRSPSFPPTLGFILSQVQGAIWRSFRISDKWGIFRKDQTPIADVAFFSGNLSGLNTFLSAASSTVDLAYSKQTKISDYPVERGSFASYNKIEIPSSPVVTMNVQGTDDERRKFLEVIDGACKSVELFDVVTPDAIYIDHAIERYDFDRTADSGGYLLNVRIVLKEIRQVSAQFSIINDPKRAEAAPQIDGGKVQPQPVSAPVSKSLDLEQVQ